MSEHSPVIIRGFGSISPLGHDVNEVGKHFLTDKTCIQSHHIHSENVQCAKLNEDGESLVNALQTSHKFYAKLDRSVLLAILASRNAYKMAQWQDDIAIGISIGSSRGATQKWESYHQSFLENKRISPLASPTTTLGNISSWVAQDLALNGPEISHSMTCTTGLHALANGMAWINGGLCEKFLCGGSEASITPFTWAQFNALGLYSTDSTNYPCKPFSNSPNNTLCMGEGAAVFALEKYNNQHEKHIMGKILSVGFGMEGLSSSTSISTEGIGFEQSMMDAMDNANLNNVDAIISHAPGTIDGDESELNAIYKVFGDIHPILLSNKWKIGHTFGASSALSVEHALHILHNQNYADYPYEVRIQFSHKPIKHIMINAAGFGGNCVSMIISR